ncbi:MAG: hypothetical protein ACTSQ8_23840 [Candidatus Helarchaeota archaeon]
MSECKVVYKEGDDIRALRGTIDGEDDIFIVLKRRDGVIRINKNNVIKIEGEA